MMNRASWAVVAVLSLAAEAGAETVGDSLGAEASLAQSAASEDAGGPSLGSLSAIEEAAGAAGTGIVADGSVRTLSPSAMEVRTSYESNEYSSMSLDDLEDELDDTSLGGPIVMLGVGGGFAIIGGIYSLSFLVVKSACDSSGGGYYEDDGCDSFGTVGTVLAVGAVGGAVLATVGGIWLGSRIGTRRELKREIRKKGGDATGFGRQWAVVPMATPKSAGLGFAATF